MRPFRAAYAFSFREASMVRVTSWLPREVPVMGLYPVRRLARTERREVPKFSSPTRWRVETRVARFSA